MKTHSDDKIKKFKEFIIENPHLLPEFLTIIGQELELFKEKCRKENDHLMREALGDACHLLGMKRKLPLNEMKMYCIRIRKAIFPDGIKQFHHQGEENFYNKYLK
jgi:hypothetical protein